MFEKLKKRLIPVLRWSERYTKTDMVYLAGGGFWLMLGYGAQLLSGLIIAVALANLIPKEAYGTYQFIISMSAIIGGFTLTGMGTALMRAVAKGSTGALATAFKTQLTWSIGIVLMSAAVSLYYFLNDNVALATAFLIVGACSPFLSAFSLYRPFLEGKQLFRESTMLGVWRRPIPIIALLAALFLTNDPIILVLVYFVSQTLSMGLLYFHITHLYPETPEEDPELVSYSKHLSFMGLVGLAANNLDNIIVFHYLGAVPVAVYALAQLPSVHLLKMFGLVGSLMFPKLAKRDFKTLKKTLAYKLVWYLLAALAVAALYVWVAPYLFSVLFPAYPEAILLSQLLILSLIAKPFTLYAQAFAAHGFKKIQHFVQISVAVLKLTLLIILLPLYGLFGAVAAILLTNLYWCIVLVVLFYTKKVSSIAEPLPTVS